MADQSHLPGQALRATERRNPRSVDIDLMTSSELVALFNAEDRTVADAVGRAAPEVAALIDAVEGAFRMGGRLFYVGAGTSGRLGVLDASECPPTFGSDPRMVQGIIAGGSAALVSAVEGAEDDRAAGAAAIDERMVGSDDVVVGIAASGTTPYVRAALDRAAEAGATTAMVTCAAIDPETAARWGIVVLLEVGPEVVTGSTRLKAGTATKMVLNMITTGAMVRIGKTWGNLMVDLQARNAKLHDRSERIVMEVAGIDREGARAAIAAAEGSVRTAIAMVLLGVDADTARRRIDDADGRLRLLIGDPPTIGAGR